MKLRDLVGLESRHSAPCDDLTRRDFLGAGILIGTSVFLGGCAGADFPVTGTSAPHPKSDVAAPDGGASGLRPDILVILTDQERYPVHWPPGLLDRLMPSWARLRRNGLTFHRAYAAASQCSPSRACLLTGEYANVNGVPTLPADGMPTLPALPNVASILGEAGYEVVWKGKWHLSFPVGFAGGPPWSEMWKPLDVSTLEQKYDMSRWNPPEAGNNAGAYGTGGVPSMGGGIPDNDGRFVRGATHEGQTPGVEGTESALDFLARMAAVPRGERPPFALFVSLVNPHDITFFPSGWEMGGYARSDFEGLGVPLPSNFGDTLEAKPSIQRAYRDALQALDPLYADAADGPTTSEYVNFYAYLHSVVDPHIQEVLDALDRYGLTKGTLVVRTADHGEAGLSHNLREKSYSAYEEMIHVPLVISNPLLFPEPKETTAFWSHVDLLPTLAELAHATPVGIGRSMVPVLVDPGTTVQDAVLFAFDDVFVLPASKPGSHIRALRHENWTYAVYYSERGGPFEYELYDNQSDPGQMENLLASPSPGIEPTWEDLHRKLVQKMVETRSAPVGFTFPPSAAAVSFREAGTRA